MSKTRVLLALTLLAAGTHCAKNAPDEGTVPAASQGGEATPGETASAPKPEPIAAPTPRGLSDAQIAKITNTVDDGEIAQANLASSRAQRDSVKQFAAHMISQHTAAKQASADVARDGSITPAASDVSDSLQRDGTATLDKLRAIPAAQFDATYIKAQLEAHEHVLALLKEQLIPSATNPQLRTQLEAARAMVERHIAEAQSIDKTIASE